MYSVKFGRTPGQVADRKDRKMASATLNGCKSCLTEGRASSPHFSSLLDAGPLKLYIVQQHHRRTPILLAHHITTNQLIKTTWSLPHSRMVPKESSKRGLQPTKTTCLLCYNLLSALPWLCIFLSVILQLDLFFLSEDRHRSSRCMQTYAYLEAWTRWTQTLALAEIIHTAAGGDFNNFPF